LKAHCGSLAHNFSDGVRELRKKLRGVRDKIFSCASLFLLFDLRPHERTQKGYGSKSCSETKTSSAALSDGRTDGANLKSDTFFLLTGPLAIFLSQNCRRLNFLIFATA
jgi:hypothetical protein